MKFKELHIDTVMPGAAFLVTTRNATGRGSSWLLVATGPAQRNVAVFTRSNKFAGGYAMCRLLGTACDSGLKPGVVSSGGSLHLEDYGALQEAAIKTRKITGIRLMPKRFSANSVVEDAEFVFAARIDAVMKKEFPPDRLSLIRELVGRFGNPAGKCVALKALLWAATSNGSGNKLGAALETMQEYCHRFWYFQRPEIAGDPAVPLNAARWRDFYADCNKTQEALLHAPPLSIEEASLKHLLSLQD